jgi:hypothetical protein
MLFGMLVAPPHWLVNELHKGTGATSASWKCWRP